jgi:hypothetical protein
MMPGIITRVINEKNMTKNITAKTFAVATAAAVALSSFALPLAASAAVNSSSITITTLNRGTIINDTSAKSHTGANTAEGSKGGRGGDGGDVTSDGSFNNGGAGSGNGGNGGNGGAGGLVDTGNATADAGTVNDLNNTDVDLDLVSAAVAGFNSTALLVDTDNGQCECNKITNDTRARARTGDNTAQGSVAGNADDAGAITGGTGNNNNGGATSGNGGNGGAGGLGGTVYTGNAGSVSATVNMLNTILVRARI